MTKRSRNRRVLLRYCRSQANIVEDLIGELKGLKAPTVIAELEAVLLSKNKQ